MPEQSIKSEDMTLKRAFQDFYTVPDYQREYVWGEADAKGQRGDEVEQFLRDIQTEFEMATEQNAPEYFIGTIEYVSDRFAARQAEVQREAVDESRDFSDNTRDAYVADALENRDQFTGHNVYYIPEEARWDYLKAHAAQIQPSIGV